MSKTDDHLGQKTKLDQPSFLKTRPGLRVRGLSAAFLCLVIGSSFGLGQSAKDNFVTPLMQAQAMYEAKDFSGAEKLSRQIVQTNPTSEKAWSLLARSLKNLGRYDEAITTFQKVLEVGGDQPTVTMYNTAACYALLGRKDESLKWLERAITAGFPYLNYLRGDDDFKTLRAEPKFKQLALIVDVSNLSRVEGWRSDLDLIVKEMKRLHAQLDSRRNAQERAAQEFDNAVKALSEAIPKLSDDEIGVGFMKLLRRFGDGHTSIGFGRDNAATAKELPVRFSLFEEGSYISQATKEHEDLLWARLVSIEGKPMDEVYRTLDSVIPQDNVMTMKSRAPGMLRNLRVLKALGLAASSDQLKLEIVDQVGNKRSVAVDAEALGPSPQWLRAPSGVNVEVPLYLRKTTDNYWFTYLANEKTVYCQYNRCNDKPEESMSKFAERLFAFVAQNEVEKLVFDLRLNGGGDNFLDWGFWQGCIRAAKINQPGHLFVIAGRNTFSSAMVFATEMDRFTNAIFVGEPTGSSPNFVGRNNVYTLPYSKMQASIADVYWQNSHGLDYRIWISPQIYAPPTFESYRSGKDPALEAIFSYRRDDK